MITFQDFNLSGKLREESKIKEEANLEQKVRIFKRFGITDSKISGYLEICADKCLEVADEVGEMVYYKN